MSYKAQIWAQHIKAGSSSVKAVLNAVAFFADDDGQTWRSQGEIARHTELTDRTVRAALATLEERGLLVREERSRKDGGRSTDILTLRLGAAQPSLLSANACQDNSSAPPGKSFQGGRNRFPAPPERRSGHTTFEPTSNRQGNRQKDSLPVPLFPEAADARDDQDVERKPSSRRKMIERSVAILCAITGKNDRSARGTVGIWLSRVQDDAKVVLDLVEAADEREVADPTMWVEGQIRRRQEQLSGDQGLRRSPRDPPPDRVSPRAARLIDLHAQLSGAQDHGSGPRSDDDLIPLDDLSGSGGEDRDPPWPSGGDAEPSEPVRRAAFAGGYDHRAARTLRRAKPA
ncbi:hypothetical protein GCM10007887_05110 [Methylobacterium haplocladii]|uniref:Helix-turn-helix domain-containing protein n=1 Tax=Methylobacterium haplocladii TaxID=1176176 RepID=A0A512IS67_9HYPH|nr:hypothetical protein MHA02_29420 [Methylobacterium haplocladii]GLS57855.1 hypothetical protein GCM10007887_05110 [Methylobacterium haplocladii]